MTCSALLNCQCPPPSPGKMGCLHFKSAHVTARSFLYLSSCGSIWAYVSGLSVFSHSSIVLADDFGLTNISGRSKPYDLGEAEVERCEFVGEPEIVGDMLVLERLLRCCMQAG